MGWNFLLASLLGFLLLFIPCFVQIYHPFHLCIYEYIQSILIFVFAVWLFFIFKGELHFIHWGVRCHSKTHVIESSSSASPGVDLASLTILQTTLLFPATLPASAVVIFSASMISFSYCLDGRLLDHFVIEYMVKNRKRLTFI